jgi:L-threonylcarbamoyladenylate synthase
MATWRIRRAVQALNKGGIIAYPTEAVFGLGCDPWDEQAALKLLEFKQRPLHKGLILIAADFNQLQEFIKPVSPTVLQRINHTWPGPNTWLLPARDNIPYYLCGKYDTIAVRVTAHKQAADLCRAFGGPLVSTSANLAGMNPAKTTREVHWRLPELDYVVSGLCSGADKPTHIRNAMTGEQVR